MLRLLTTPGGRLATNLALSALFLRFAWTHALAFQATGRWLFLVFLASEAALVVFFLARRAPVDVADDAKGWALAVGGTLAPQLFAPGGATVSEAAGALVLAGALVQLAGILSLARSFGIVPANRGLTTAGPYRLVRHPIYASYFLSYTGYVLTQASPPNVAVLALVSGLTLGRIRAEEALLSRDPAYRAYAERVRWRLIPGLW